MLLVLSVPELNFEYKPSDDSQKEFHHKKTNELVVSSSSDNTVEEYDQVLIVSNTLVTFGYLAKVLKRLKPHASVTVKFVKGTQEINVKDAETEMKLCGLLSIASKTDSSDETELFQLSGSKPDFSSQGIRRSQKSNDLLKSIITSASESTSVRLLDDSDLLKEEDMLRKNEEAAEECGPQAKKKACKNCSCGLKEVEEEQQAQKQSEEETKVIDTTNVKSSCGSCYLGDAFRCGGCPYRGLPAFKPGEQVKLPSSMLEDDLDL